VDLRNDLYRDAITGEAEDRLEELFAAHLEAAQKQYAKELPESHDHIKNMTEDEKKEYCRLYALDVPTWKAEYL
jgi:hypothetical protein